VIRDSRTQDANVGVLIEDTVGPVVLENNRIETQTPIDDRRAPK